MKYPRERMKKFRSRKSSKDSKPTMKRYIMTIDKKQTSFTKLLRN
jgi:hypothetical protein